MRFVHLRRHSRKPPMSLAPAPERSDASLSLARALIGTSALSVLLFGDGLKVMCASRTFYDAFDLTPALTEGRILAQVGAGEWNIPQLGILLDNAFTQDPLSQGYETDLVRPYLETRRLSVTVEAVAYPGNPGPLVLLTITDLTQTRRMEQANITLLLEKDTLLRERAILMQEMQHRVANSLQIIASVLMLKARTVKSEETRQHLRDAHDRVMSVAAVQQHLQESLGLVDLGSYLTKLCESLAYSMIGDSRPLTLKVIADDAEVSSHVAVSLGLIVTELVINALKHAFPDGRPGSVVVGYALTPQGWNLCVVDDGVGRPQPGPEVRVGLGTTVVESLAKQMGGRVEITDAGPGACIAIINDGSLKQPIEALKDPY
jgi:two-component sensor histidine kinase